MNWVWILEEQKEEKRNGNRWTDIIWYEYNHYEMLSDNEWTR